MLDKGLDGDPAVDLPIKTLEKYWFASTGGIQVLPTRLCPLRRPQCPQCVAALSPAQVLVPRLVFFVLCDHRGLPGGDGACLAEPAGSCRQSQTPRARGAAFPALSLEVEHKQPRGFLLSREIPGAGCWGGGKASTLCPTAWVPVVATGGDVTGGVCQCHEPRFPSPHGAAPLQGKALYTAAVAHLGAPILDSSPPGRAGSCKQDGKVSLP